MLETIAAWSAYAKDRFDTVCKRVDEFRNWARQLAGVIGVVIGFEFSLTGRVLDLKSPFDQSLRTLVLVVLLLTILFQMWLLQRALRSGYLGHQVLGPESPTVLAQFIADKDEITTRQIIGAYYAKACDNFQELSERLGVEVARATKLFCGSLVSLLVGLILLVWLSTQAYTGGPMAATSPTPTAAPASSSTPTPQPSMAAAAPTLQRSPTPAPFQSPAPLLFTPTVGRSSTFSATPTRRAP